CNYQPTNPNRPDTAEDRALRVANCSALGIPEGWIDTFSASRPGVSGGNPDLEEERARSWTLGLVWQPDFINGLGVSVDYWNITHSAAHGGLNAHTLAARCVVSPGGIGNQFSAMIARAPVGGYVDPQGRDSLAYSYTRWVALNEKLAKSRR